MANMASCYIPEGRIDAEACGLSLRRDPADRDPDGKDDSYQLS